MRRRTFEAQRGRSFGSVLGCAFFLAAPLEARTPSVVLSFETTAGCPSRKAFEEKVRLVESTVVFSSVAPREFVVRLERRGHEFRASLSVGDFSPSSSPRASEEPSARSISGATCEEVADALALAVALAFSEEVKAEEQSVPVTLPEEEPPETEAPATKKPAETSPKTPAPALVPETAKKSPLSWLLTTRGTGSFDRGPGFGVSVDLGGELRGELISGVRSSVRLGAGFHRSASDAVVLEGLPIASGMLCPYWFEGGVFEGTFCGEFVFARMVSTPGPAAGASLGSAVRPLSFANLTGRLAWPLGAFHLEVFAGLETPLSDVEYRVAGLSEPENDEVVLHIEPSLSGLGGLNVGWRIP